MCSGVKTDPIWAKDDGIFQVSHNTIDSASLYAAPCPKDLQGHHVEQAPQLGHLCRLGSIVQVGRLPIFVSAVLLILSGLCLFILFAQLSPLYILSTHRDCKPGFLCINLGDQELHNEDEEENNVEEEKTNCYCLVQHNKL